jgi:hypothetical protein
MFFPEGKAVSVEMCQLNYNEAEPKLNTYVARGLSECEMLSWAYLAFINRLCGLVVGVSGYRYRGPGFDPRRYQIFW